MAIVIKAPEDLEVMSGSKTVRIFLAGSIEQGAAEDWQSKFEEELKDEDFFILNPRRDNWDASLEQSIDNEKFKEQVVWELAALELSDLIVLYFDPATKSPISLLELGLFAKSNKLVVVCPDGFWRKGNVDIVCERYNIPLAKDLDTVIDIIKHAKNV